MKRQLLISILLGLVLGSFAQDKKEKKSALSLGGEVVYPLKQNRFRKGIDFGGSLQQEFLLSKVGITINLGAASANHLNSSMNLQSWLMAGARLYFNSKMFAGGQLGGGVVAGSDYAVGTFVYSGGAGIKLKPIDLSLYYRGLNVSGELYSTAGVRIGLIL